jgi:hypothetical protein
MRIAVIGWGSLVWCPACLQIKSRWHSDGPALPIEFARISSDKRLTLVIFPGSPDQHTYWALSEFDGLKAARENLQAREGTTSKHIRSLTADGQEEGAVDPKISASIREWLAGHQSLHAAIWTGLISNWWEKRGKQFTPEDAVAYLRELESQRDQAKANYDRAREYIRNAPLQIQTTVRRMMQVEKGWEDAKLPTILFERAEGDA